MEQYDHGYKEGYDEDIMINQIILYMSEVSFGKSLEYISHYKEYCFLLNDDPITYLNTEMLRWSRAHILSR